MGAKDYEIIWPLLSSRWAFEYSDLLCELEEKWDWNELENVLKITRLALNVHGRSPIFNSFDSR